MRAGRKSRLICLSVCWTPVLDNMMRKYFMFFSNPSGMVSPGDLMTLAVGDIRINNIPVEESPEPMNTKAQEKIQRKKIKAWQMARKKLRQEFEECRSACQGNSACLDRCGDRLAEQEKREYIVAYI